MLRWCAFLCLLVLGETHKEFEDQEQTYISKDSSFSKESDDGLVLVHVLFRHGERTVDPTTLFPTDPYINETYYPYGVGQLTAEGKRTEYRLGKALRRRYDRFLGRVYSPDLLDARSTDVNRTKMSLELVLAGLFPPIGDQIFEPGLFWQPIPYNVVPRKEDKELLGIFCKNYLKLYKEFTETPKLRKEYDKHKELFEYLSEKTGWTIKHYGDVFYVYWGLRSEKEWGFELPEWTRRVFPKPLEDLVIREYYITSGTARLRQLAAGYLLKKMLLDTKNKIEGKLVPQTRKIFLYSAHESNIANFLASLDVFQPQIPPYGSYILVEIHKVRGEYGVKLFYEDYKGKRPKPLKIKYCEEFCRLELFTYIIRDIIPETDDLCG